jgi:hypothetical protein
MLKSCCRCSHEAEFSIVCVFSTVGLRPRRQKCSAAVLYCRACLRTLLDEDQFLPSDLWESVNNAYTHVERPMEDPTDRETGDTGTATD